MRPYQDGRTHPPKVTKRQRQQTKEDPDKWLLILEPYHSAGVGEVSFQCVKGGTIPKTNEIGTHICSCHNFFPLSSVQIIIIPACCLLCVL